MYNKDYLGVEVHFPKGRKGARDLIVDGCIFDDKEWVKHYKKWKEKKDYDELKWLKEHLVGIIEFKRPVIKDDKLQFFSIKECFSLQVKPAMNESDTDYCIGLYYDEGRLYIFQKKNGKIIRYDESKNEKGVLSLDFADAYYMLPTFEDIIYKIVRGTLIDKSKRTFEELEPISGHTFSNIREVMTKILQVMERLGVIGDARAYEILIQVLALKIYDEKHNSPLQYFILDDEYKSNLTGKDTQKFIKRIQELYENAKSKFIAILLEKEDVIDWKKEVHIKFIKNIVYYFQDYSFIKSIKNHLYQLVFYRFAHEFRKELLGQFITPIPLIDFLVDIVNPKGNESICDPTCGIADFLSLSYVNSIRISRKSLDDNNLYGMDNDERMIMLAQFNMLLNGDGNAKLYSVSGDKGAIQKKIATDGSIIDLLPDSNKDGKWEQRTDKKQIMKFDVILTNPPFGENRPYKVETDEDKEIIKCYELWERAKQKDWIDKGVIFLENAYRVLKPEGRLGIVLSNSILSIDRWSEVQKWIVENLRVVAIFDLPPSVFADTASNTCLLVAYKPKKEEFEKLKENNYEVFVKNITKVGYQVKSIKRVKNYIPLFKRDDTNFQIEVDEKGESKRDEEFTEIIKEFKVWINTQEETLVKKFS